MICAILMIGSKKSDKQQYERELAIEVKQVSKAMGNVGKYEMCNTEDWEQKGNEKRESCPQRSSKAIAIGNVGKAATLL
jgi:hypothetical protein